MLTAMALLAVLLVWGFAAPIFMGLVCAYAGFVAAFWWLAALPWRLMAWLWRRVASGA